jgi:uncharacterized membrane protein
MVAPEKILKLVQRIAVNPLRKFLTHRLNLILLYLLLLGLLFRIIGINSKVFWVDEVSTAIRVSGFTRSEITQTLSQQHSQHQSQQPSFITPADLKSFQFPTRPRPFNQTLQALKSSPEHAPLYFILTRLWLDQWGYSIASLRSLPILFSLLSLPTLYWCSWELFHSHHTSLLATSLLAISPFHVAYAQEARPYSLLTLLLLLASAILLHSCQLSRSVGRLDSASAQSTIPDLKSPPFPAYAIALILSLYTSLLSVFVVGSHLIYVAIQDRFRLTPTLRQVAGAIALSLLCFSPWLYHILTSLETVQDNTTWMRVAMAGWAMLAIWLYSIVILFVDFPVYLAADPVILGAICTDLVLLGLIIYAFYFLGRTTSAWKFVFSLSLVPLISLVILDWIQGGQSSTAPRYLIALHLGILLAIAHLFSQKLAQPTHLVRWKLLLIGIITMGVMSCATNLEDSPRYQKTRNLHNGAIAQLINQSVTNQSVTNQSVINQSAAPQILSEEKNIMDLLSLSHSLHPDVKIQIIRSITTNALPQENPSEILPNIEAIASSSNLFLFNPSQTLMDQVATQQDLNITPVYQPQVLIPGEISLSLFQIRILPK